LIPIVPDFGSHAATVQKPVPHLLEEPFRRSHGFDAFRQSRVLLFRAIAGLMAWLVTALSIRP
jgi:hypothetical protein